MYALLYNRHFVVSCESHPFAANEVFSSSKFVTSWTHKTNLLTAEWNKLKQIALDITGNRFQLSRR